MVTIRDSKDYGTRLGVECLECGVVQHSSDFQQAALSSE